jgi:hypothetical protein
MFDERYNTGHGIRGGRLKDHALLSPNGVPYRVKFKDRPSLDGLLNELATTFAVRYEKEPTETALRDLARLSPRDCLLSIVMESSPNRYLQRMEKLEDPTWLVKTIRDYLQDCSLWPTDDQAISQLVGIVDGTRKRTLDQTRMERQVPRLRKMPKTM